jgi:D-xylose transport system substrate-binding protein
MKIFRVTMFAIFLSLLLIGLFGCGKKKDSGKITIGLLLDVSDPDHRQRDEQYFTGQAKSMGAEVIRAVAEGTQESQNKQALEMLNDGVDVLVVMAMDPKAAAEIVKAAHQKNVPVIAYDLLIPDCDLDMSVTFDNEKIGYIQLLGALQTVSKGNFILLGGAQSDKNSIGIRAGQVQSIKDHELSSGNKITILADPFLENGDAKEAQDKVASLLSKFKSEGKKVDAIIATTDAEAIGAIAALTTQNLQGKVAVSGQGGELTTCQRIAEGIQAASVYKPAKKIAPVAAEVAVRLARKESPDSIAASLKISVAKINNGTKDVPAILIDPAPITGDNILSVIVKEKVFPMDKVFANVPKDKWPK